jgi:hypothetical protein
VGAEATSPNEPIKMVTNTKENALEDYHRKEIFLKSAM